MSTRLVCPNCHTEMFLPERNEMVMGMTLPKETGGTHVLQADVIKNDNLNTTKLNNKENKIMNTRESRMETLKVNGVNVGKFFDVQLPNGGSIRMTFNAEGIPVVADVTNDPILNQIIEDGYVRNTKLHRRWIMSQTFKMLNYISYNGRERGWDACLRNNYGYMYQFSMMLEEIRVLSKLEDRDMESFNERSHFFTKDVVVATCKDYLEKLKASIEKQKPKSCKGVPYKRVKGQNIFVSDLEKKVYLPITRQIWKISAAKNYKELYRELCKFNNSMIKLPWETKKCKTWIDAYKGSGSFYTLKNLVMFHSCKIVDEQRMGWNQPRKVDIYTGTDAVKFIQSKLNEYKNEGWRYHAMLKKCIADNNFSFDQRMAEIYDK